jgi:radical SAM protein with 4Fe4S-binding SPASM domain
MRSSAGSSDAARRPPRRALWEITWRCDRRCSHCLVRGGAPKGSELNTREALDLVDQLADLVVPVVSLTGGEPFLRGDWREIAERTRARGMRLRFSTNGHLLDADTVRALVDLGTESVSVSLDGAKETHDRLRPGPVGDSSFDLVLAALRRLRSTPINAGAITTVSRQNFAELPRVHAILKEHGVRRWLVQLAHRTGRLADRGTPGACDPIDPAQLHLVAEFITTNARDPVLAPRAAHNIGYLGGSEPVLRGSGRTGHPLWRGCRCGVSSIGIEPDGGIKGCANQVGAPFVVGNIRDEALERIWRDGSRWHWLDPSPERMTGACTGCALAAVCQAGCTVLALRSSGAMFDNPYCLRRIERAGREAGA